ncbi:hypothetical protein EDB83DRAFT_2516984 [Lactarius deliciosus]|nr:hypothetical protein EDB83DRAFT_2516984 [Lactarius deliciosus]
MYYNEEVDDPYAPRIGPAAMPSPRSEYAPYYSGRNNMFEDFLEEFEGLAYDCALTDPQRVDAIIRYFDPSICELCRSFNGFCSRNWPLLRQSLINVFGSITPRPQVMRQRQFLCLGEPLVHSGHLSKEERDIAFLCGFHPEDRKVLQPCLLSKNPFQPPDIPFHFDIVFSCACAAFAYDNYLSSPWSQKLKFEPSSVRRDQPVVEPIPQDSYSFQAVTCAITSNAEMTSNLDKRPLPPQSTPQPQFPLSSPLVQVLESQQTQAPSVMLDQPETAYTLSSTLLPSASFASPPSHARSLVHSATDNDPIFAPTFSITASTPPLSSLIPSAFPSPTHTHSLAPLAAADVPEISSTHYLSSTASIPSPTTLISYEFKCLPSAMVDQPEFEPEPVCLSSITPTSPCLPFTPSLVCVPADDDPEIAPTLLHSIPSTPYAPLLASLATDSDPISTSMPSLSPTSSTFLPLVMEEQPEPELESMQAITPSSTFAPTPLSSSTFLPSPVSMRLAMNSQPKIESALVSESAIPPSIDHVPEIASAPGLSLPPTLLSASKACSEVLTSLSSPTKLPPPETPTSIPAHSSWPLRSSPGDSSDTVVELVIVPVSLNSSSSSSSLGKLIPLLPAQHEVSVAGPTSRYSTPPQRSPGFMTVGSDSSTLEVTPAFALSTIVYEVSSTLAAPHFSHTSTSRLRSGFSFARLTLVLSFVTIAALVSTLFNASTTVLTDMRKFQSKIEDFGNSQIGNLNTSSHNDLTHRLRLGQYTPCTPCLVFDPGGPVQAFKFQVLAHKDVRKCKSKTHNGLHHMHDTALSLTLTIPIPIDNLVFGPRGGAVNIPEVRPNRGHLKEKLTDPLTPYLLEWNTLRLQTHLGPSHPYNAYSLY